MDTPPPQEYMDSMTEALDKFYAEDFIEAAEICQDALKANPKGAEAYFILGMVSLRFDNPGRAVSLMEKAHELDTECREYSDALASILTRIGKLSEGLFYAKLSVAQEPHPVLSNLLPRDLENYFQALREAKPPGYFFQGLVHFQSGKYQDAVEKLKVEVDINPDNAWAHQLLGRSYIGLRRYQDSIMLFKKAMELDPSEIRNNHYLAQAMLGMGNPEIALDSYKRALDLEPETENYHAGYVNTLSYMGDKEWKAFPGIHREFLDSLPNRKQTFDRGREIIDEVRKNNKKIEDIIGKKTKIRLGVISDYFYDCEKGYWLESFLKPCDRNRFEIYCYHDTTIRDDMTTRFEGYADLWRPMHEVNTLTAAKIIAGDDLDVLMDASGFAEDPRFLLLAMRPAPKQVSWLGLPQIGGIEGIDCVLGDAQTIKNDKTYVTDEKCIQLDSPLVTITPFGFMPDVNKSPAKSRDHVTFGGHLEPARLNEETASLWCSALEAVPDATLLLGNPINFHPDTRDFAEKLFKDRGVSDRIRIDQYDENAGLSPIDEEVGFYSRIDVLLDTTPVNGGLELCRALWMGVPVLTLAGKRRQSLMGASILSAARRPDWIAKTPKEFAKRAGKLAKDIDGLASIRESLRDEVGKTELFSPANFSKAMCDAIEKIHQNGAA